MRKRNLLRRKCALLTALMLFSAMTVNAAAGPASVPDSETVPASLPEASEKPAKQNDIIILYTNDVHCGIDDSIGYAGLALYEKQMKQLTPHVTLVDAGDAIQGAPVGTLSEGRYLIDIMNQLDYDVAVPGNHEFDYGMERFLELAGELDCEYTSCNFMALSDGRPVFDTYQMIAYGDTDVAYIGISTPESFTKSTPVYFQDAAGNYIYGFCEDGSGEALYAQVQKTVDEARAAGAEYVVAVGHLGNAGVTAFWTSEAVIASTTGIDVFIDGHSHETVPSKTVMNKDGKSVLLTQTGTKLAAIGKLVIGADGSLSTELINEVSADLDDTAASAYTVLKGDSLSRIAGRMLGSAEQWEKIYEMNRMQIGDPDLLWPGMILSVPGSVTVTEDGRAVDAAADAFIRNIQSQYEESMNVVVGHTDYELTTLDPATGERAVRNAETNLGDFCADAYRVVLGADVGLINGGGIRADVEPGSVTYNDMLSVFPFGNMGCVSRISGQQLLDTLEMGASYYPEENGSFLHVSGMTYQIDSSVPSSVKEDEKGNFICVDGEYRVKNVTVGGEPLDLQREYTVASHNYYLKSGGGGMTMLTAGELLQDEVKVEVDILAEYINTYLGGTVGESYADPAGQGRIRIIG